MNHAVRQATTHICSQFSYHTHGTLLPIAAPPKQWAPLIYRHLARLATPCMATAHSKRTLPLSLTFSDVAEARIVAFATSRGMFKNGNSTLHATTEK